MDSTRFTAAMAELTRPGGGIDLGHDRARIAVRLMRLLAKGHPVARAHALDSIAELGIDRQYANTVLDGWTERDTTGGRDDIVGFGLTYNQTPHQMIIDGVRMWAWCGMDTVVFSHVLDKSIDIESAVPDTGEIIRLHATPSGITDVDPAGAVATQRAPSNDQVDTSSAAGIWGSFCHHNFFFPDRATAQRWVADRGDIGILSIPEAFTVARDIAGALLRYEPGRAVLHG